MGANAQVALEKFARYFDVEVRLMEKLRIAAIKFATLYYLVPSRACDERRRICHAAEGCHQIC